MGWILKHYQNLESHQINKARFAVGRDKEADLICRNILVSKHHSEITQEEDGRLAVTDLKSSNGTFINQERLVPFVKIGLNSGDVLSFGLVKPPETNNKNQPNYIFHVQNVPDVIEILTSDDDDDFAAVPPKKPKIVKEESNLPDGTISPPIPHTSQDVRPISLQTTIQHPQIQPSSSLQSVFENGDVVGSTGESLTRTNSDEAVAAHDEAKRVSMENLKTDIREGKAKRLKVVLPKMVVENTQPAGNNQSERINVLTERNKSESCCSSDKPENGNSNKHESVVSASGNFSKPESIASGSCDFNKPESVNSESCYSDKPKSVASGICNLNKAETCNAPKALTINSSGKPNEPEKKCMKRKKINTRSSRNQLEHAPETETIPLKETDNIPRTVGANRGNDCASRTSVTGLKQPERRESNSDIEAVPSSRNSGLRVIETMPLKGNSSGDNGLRVIETMPLKGNSSGDNGLRSGTGDIEKMPLNGMRLDLFNKTSAGDKVKVIENRIVSALETPTCSKYLNENPEITDEDNQNVETNENEVEPNNLIGKIHIATNLFSTPKKESKTEPVKTEPQLNYSMGDNVIELDDNDDDDYMGFMLSQLYVKTEIKKEEGEEDEGEGTSPCSDFPDVIAIDDDDGELFTSVCSQMYTNENNKRQSVDDEMFMHIKQEVAALDSYDVPTALPPITLSDTFDTDGSEDILDVLSRSARVNDDEAPSCSREKGYKVPPIVEPHMIEVKKKQRIALAVKPPARQAKKPLRKSPRVSKGKAQSSLISTASKKQNKDIQDARRQKLKEIALKTAKAREKSPEHPAKITTALKNTKTSSSRGNFLLKSNDPPNRVIPSPPPNRVSSIAPTNRVLPSPPPNKAVPSPPPNRVLPSPPPNRVLLSPPAAPKRIEQIPRAVPMDVHNRRFLDEHKDVVQNIMVWNQKWIEEQHRKQELPPIVGRKVIKMCDSFHSYADYHNVLQPLIMAELWFNMCKDYESSSASKPNASNGNLPAKLEAVKINSYYTEIIFTSYLDKETSDMGNHTQVKNIVLLSACFGKNIYKTFFGVVAWMQKEPLKFNAKIDQKLIENCKSVPTVKLTFMAAVKKFAEPINTNYYLNMRYFNLLPQYLKLFQALKQLGNSPLVKHITDPQIALFDVHHQRRNSTIGDSLNESQAEALCDMLYLFENDRPGMYLLEGPPGTGKSTVIISLIIEWLVNLQVKNKCILLLAPSNGAVDSIINKLMFLVKPMLKEEDRHKIKLVRVGNTAAIDPNIRKYSLDEMARVNVSINFLQEHPQTRKDYNELSKQIAELNKRLESNPSDRDVRRELDRKMSERSNFAQNYLKSKYRSKFEEQKLVLLNGAKIICSTLMSSPKIFTKGFPSSSIKICIIDEVSQCSEAESLMPIGLGIDKIVMVGDPQQLPAISSSMLVKNYGYCRSLFSRIKINLSRQKKHAIKMLNVQYRMHPEICRFPNREYYDGRIKTEFSYKKPLERLRPYLVFGQSTLNTAEYENRKEIELLMTLVRAVTGVVPREQYLSIGIITPYAVQRGSINAALRRERFGGNVTITCNTVDSFQGQEKDVILLSCVRNTPNSFLSDAQRLNVSLTRAKYALYIIASDTLLKSCPVLKKINNDAKERGLRLDLRNSPSQSAFVDMITNKK